MKSFRRESDPPQPCNVIPVRTWRTPLPLPPLLRIQDGKSEPSGFPSTRFRSLSGTPRRLQGDAYTPTALSLPPHFDGFAGADPCTPASRAGRSPLDRDACDSSDTGRSCSRRYAHAPSPRERYAPTQQESHGRWEWRNGDLLQRGALFLVHEALHDASLKRPRCHPNPELRNPRVESHPLLDQKGPQRQDHEDRTDRESEASPEDLP